MASITVQMPQNMMENCEKDDFGIVPYMGSLSAVNNGPMLNDCFFGSEQHMPSPLFKRNTSIEAVEFGDDNLVSSPVETQTVYNVSPAVVESSFVGYDQCQPCNYPSIEPPAYDGQGAGNGKTDPVATEDWIEEWMDLNGIFDPAMELLYAEGDLPPFPVPDHLKAADGFQNLETSLHIAAQDLNKQVDPETNEERNFHEAAFMPTEPQNYPNLNGFDENAAAAAVRRKAPVKDYVFRPAPVDLDKPSAVFAGKQQLRSTKIIKASAAVRLNEAQKQRSRGQKTNSFISERKREQNRSAAVRYRDRRREEARRKKEELRELELRNVSLKTQISGLEEEIGYLRKLLDDILCK